MSMYAYTICIHTKTIYPHVCNMYMHMFFIYMKSGKMYREMLNVIFLSFKKFEMTHFVNIEYCVEGITKCK